MSESYGLNRYACNLIKNVLGEIITIIKKVFSN